MSFDFNWVDDFMTTGAFISVLYYNDINQANFLASVNENDNDSFHSVLDFFNTVNRPGTTAEIETMMTIVSKESWDFFLNTDISNQSSTFENFIKLSYMAGDDRLHDVIEKLDQLDKSGSVIHTGNVHDFFLNLAQISKPPLFQESLSVEIVKMYIALEKIDYLLSHRDVDTVVVAKMDFNDFYAITHML
jgi:hypothetical protein